jgi:pyruvate dehydrogenase E1 component alpha subunit
MYRHMYLIRRFEARASLHPGKINGFCHLYIGQEAVAVGCPRRCGRTTTRSAPTAITAIR